MTATAPRHPGWAWALGVLAMLMFGATLPMTQLATRAQGVPQLSPWLVTCGRCVVAAALSAMFLLLTRSAWPERRHWPALALASAGNAVLYPLLLALALQTLGTAHAAVITALGPLLTSAVAAWWWRQRPPLSFWLCALAGCAVVMGFSLWRSGPGGQFGSLHAADGLLALGVLAASVGYVAGARVTPDLGAERTICWVTLLALPVTVPGAWWALGQQGSLAQVAPAAWWGLAYVSVFSMWAGFFAWYRALAWGPAAQIGQVQLLQPFFAVLVAWPVLGDVPTWPGLLCMLLVVALVAWGKRLSAVASAR